MYVGLIQETDPTEATNPLLQAVESMPDGTVLIKGNMTLINLNLSGKVSLCIFITNFALHVFENKQ